METMNCPMCNEYEECIDHVLVDCPYAKKVFEGISSWCNVNMEAFHMVKEVMKFASQWGMCHRRSKLLLIVSYGTLWSIWKSMNERVFRRNRLPPDKVCDIVKSLTYLWVKNRGKVDRIEWATWSQCPLSY
ncbi:unnamed protein product [Lactuca virosa]|uniref:Reverse transcriptase zinc-binding domain-containing protein n=1 Tax=Lactuca virosa TaxID=75947 RepID=A0AAU9LRJ8_9ASTR|nr:unnamed protein product [Lactuca virosa]